METAERLDLLAKVPLFAGLTPAALELVAGVATDETYPTGTCIFEHGDIGDKLYIILSGRVRISRNVPGMGEEALAVLNPGAIFGEMALLDDTPRSADAPEGSGYLMGVATRNDQGGRADLVILDAQSFAAPPVATVHLPVRVPFGFHGNWFSAD